MVMLDHRKSEFIKYLVNTDQYITLALLSQCKTVLDPEFSSIAGICATGESFEIRLHPWLLNRQQWEFNFIMLHELRHIPQMAYLSNLWKAIDYPAWCTDTKSQQHAARMVMNPAMDVALHEDLKNLLGTDLQPRIQPMLIEFMAFLGITHTGDVLGAFAQPDWNRNQDTAYYATQILKMQQPPENFDDHDFEGTDLDALQVNAEEVVTRAVAEGQAMAYKAGRQASDSSIQLGKDPIDAGIKNAIQRIKVVANRIAQNKDANRYNWSRINKLWPNLPGRAPAPSLSTGVFFVADTSGSMCTPQILNQLIPALEELKKKAMIVGAYACDVELSPFNRTVKGGGGTELSARHALELRRLHNIKPKARIDIVYVTDGEVNGLDEILKDPTVTLHMVKV